jgi:hypothetical protein
MEDVLDLYAEASDPKHPVVCFDESPTQLILTEYNEARPPSGTLVLRQNPDADLPGCHADDEGENDRSLITSDTKTTRHRLACLQSPDRLAASTGISKRFYVPSDWVTSDLALPAAKEATQTRSACHPHDQLYL